nr:DUF3853 family protein [Porphyromonas sp. COT-108 OH1349]
MILEELLGKPVWQMTGEELLFLARHGSQPSNTTTEASPSKEQRRYVYGLSGIAHFSAVIPITIRIKQGR